jgi:SulP family sulfate permease
VWDASAVAALDAIQTHYAKHGTAIEITGLDRESEELRATLSGQLATAH